LVLERRRHHAPGRGVVGGAEVEGRLDPARSLDSRLGQCRRASSFSASAIPNRREAAACAAAMTAVVTGLIRTRTPRGRSSQ
jgi:hypothetical protein